MRIALGQFNAVVGDLTGNADRMRDMCARAGKQDADLVVFGELAVCGYPPEDLLLKGHFLTDVSMVLEKLAADCSQTTIVAGFPEVYGGSCYNSAAVLQAGRVSKIYRKGRLLNAGVFDERRYFQPGRQPLVINVAGLGVAITICADMWDIEWLDNFLSNAGGVQMIVNIAASPFHTGKSEQRKVIISRCAENFNCVVSYCNLIGGQDELVFDGSSCIADSTGKVVAWAKAFDEDLLIADIVDTDGGRLEVKPLQAMAARSLEPIEQIYGALVLGTRDYVRKNGFTKVLLGLSGGIDSSVTTAVAVTALGAENVVGVTMPSKFSSHQTTADAGKVAKILGIEFLTVPIESVVEQFNKALQQVPGWDDKGTAYENLQARIRGSVLMSLSNQLGYLVLTSGNKSETAVGYATLYGDTAGGFAVLKDVLKTDVYKLAEHINKISDQQIIPSDVLNRAPTAELREGQKDTDHLPDYGLLDKILKAYLEEDKSAEQIADTVAPKDVVEGVVRMVYGSEYKRRQSPPGVKITPKAFGKDRRMPITNRYNGCDDTT